ncbi:nuclear transport factor 2 family protein [Pseudomonas alcaligenes]|jgi:ketosteroid isomerase-like protein|uniref:nuclear transport factor 2 family protein n=1 Tax=Aquipseudomonas alcaligenes TaxID=43263 RepID=UPI002E7B82CC|nr:nuclear transport factor 2 family protein [Pseudomonas alcaligenes]MEE1947956.1 nuclear transport factor 2 family protein [Pseudomonas alcaligenes]
MSDFLRRFATEFAALDAGNLARLGELYSDDVLFRDPLHEVRGLPALQRYFAEMYANVGRLDFDFHGFDQVCDGEGYLRWTMHFRHPRLRGGAPISVDGCSHLLWRDKVYQHRDYFDAGAMLYEHLPLMGGVIAWLKRRLA